jgi:hypothetical protein
MQVFTQVHFSPINIISQTLLDATQFSKCKDLYQQSKMHFRHFVCFTFKKDLNDIVFCVFIIYGLFIKNSFTTLKLKCFLNLGATFLRKEI